MWHVLVSFTCPLHFHSLHLTWLYHSRKIRNWHWYNCVIKCHFMSRFKILTILWSPRLLLCYLFIIIYTPSSQTSQTLDNYWFSISIIFSLQECYLYKQNHIVCDLFGFVFFFFTQHCVHEHSLHYCKEQIRNSIKTIPWYGWYTIV